MTVAAELQAVVARIKFLKHHPITDLPSERQIGNG